MIYIFDMDVLNGYLIMGIPYGEKTWRFLSEASIYEFGTSITWESTLTRRNEIIAHIFETKKEADGMMKLIAGEMTDNDFKILVAIQQRPDISLGKLESLFPKNKKIAESINKFVRTLSIVATNKGSNICFKITRAGVGVIINFQDGIRDMAGVQLKVVSLSKCLDEMKTITPNIKGVDLIRK